MRPSGTTAGCSSSTPHHLEAASALERLYLQTRAVRGAGRASTWSRARCSPSSTSRSSTSTAPRRSTKRCSISRSLAVDVYKQVLELDAEDLPSLDKLIELYLKLERWEDLLAVYTKKADIVTDARGEEGDLLGDGRRLRARAATTTRAPSTPTSAFSRSIRTTAAPSVRLDALYLATENWTELLSVLEREVDLTGDPYEADLVSLSHRRALGSDAAATPRAQSTASARSSSSRPTTRRRWRLSRA